MEASQYILQPERFTSLARAKVVRRKRDANHNPSGRHFYASMCAQAQGNNIESFRMITNDSVPVERNEAKSDNRFCNWSKVDILFTFPYIVVPHTKVPRKESYRHGYDQN